MNENEILTAVTEMKDAAIAKMREKADQLQELQRQARQLAAEFLELQTKVQTYVELERRIMEAEDPPADAAGQRISLDDGGGRGTGGLHQD